MTYSCPVCSGGSLKPTEITYLRQWNGRMVTLPNFPAWRCDSCGYTRYDSAALARVELVFGPDADSLMESPMWRTRRTSGPDDRGPRRWSY